MMEPVLKWAGGKRKLVSNIIQLIDIGDLKKHRLFEPFFGGGSLTFALECPNATINDLNPELYNVYIQIRDNPDELIKLLKAHDKKHSHDYFYQIRDLDRLPSYKKMSPLKKAARIIYLNRTCFNGLYRVNSKGFFNVPLGRTTSGKHEIVCEEKIRQISAYLNKPGVEILNCDFVDAVSGAKKGDYVYLDPPYDYEPSGFTSYTSTGFSREDLQRLENLCDSLIEKGAIVIISNNSTAFVNEIFPKTKYKFNYLDVHRNISGNNSGRRTAREVLIYGKK